MYAANATTLSETMVQETVMRELAHLLATAQANQSPPPPPTSPADVSSLPTSGFWQSSGLAAPPLRFFLPARQQVSHLAVASGTVSSFSTGICTATRKKSLLFRFF